MSDDINDRVSSPIPPGYRILNWNRGFGRSIGPLFEREDSGARAFRVEEHHTNGMANCHGGMLMTFADMAFGHPIGHDPNLWWVTVRLTCDFLSSARLGEWVEGDAVLLNRTDDGLFTTRGRLWCGDRTIMTGTGVFKTIERRG